MRQKIGMRTEMDEKVSEWLAGHHVTDKDVISWSATGTRGDMTSMSIAFFVSGVDEMPDKLVVQDAIDLQQSRQFDRLWRALLDRDVLPDWTDTPDKVVDVLMDIVDTWKNGLDKTADTPDMSTDNGAETPSVVQQYLAEPVTVQMEAVTEPRWADLARPDDTAVRYWGDMPESSRGFGYGQGHPRPIKDNPQA